MDIYTEFQIEVQRKMRNYEDYFCGQVECLPVIYHYTSQTGFEGILKKEPTFWFSRYNALNDKSEGNDILEVYEKTIKELRDGKEQKISEEFYEIIKDIRVSEQYLFGIDDEPYTDHETNESVPCTRFVFEKGKPYLCCFSEDMDSLPMWNYYCKGGKYLGYNIGICMSTLVEHTHDLFGKGYNLKLFKVIYDDKEKEQILSDLVCYLYEQYIRISDKDGSDINSYIRNIIASFVNEYRFAFKKKYFEHEKEIRAVLIVPDEKLAYFVPDEKLANTEVENDLCVRFRDCGEFIVPYIEYKLPSKDIVTSVWYAPMDASEEIKKDKDALLEERIRAIGYNAKVHHSKIPVRY